MTTAPGTLTWRDPTGESREAWFGHIETGAAGGVAAFHADAEIDHPSEKVLTLGPAVPWSVEWDHNGDGD